MPTYTKDQLIEAVDTLPENLRGVLFSSNIEQKVQKIGMVEGLLIDQISTLNNLVNFAILNLIPRDSFSSIIEQEILVNTEVAKKLADDISREIFASVEAMEAQEKKEEKIYEINSISEPDEANISEEPVSEIPVIKTIKVPDIAPENLPIAETVEPFLPPIPLKNPAKEKEVFVHPFEEKMKNVFTTIKQPSVDPIVEQSSQTPSPKETPKAPPIYHADPYREPIE